MKVVMALWLRNIKIFARNKVQIAMAIIMPFFFLYVFGAIFKNDYISDPINYMLAGIVITNVFQIAFNIASSTIDDIVSGFMKEILVSPVKRIHIALGQILSSATIAMGQGIVTLIIGFTIGLRFSYMYTPFVVIVLMFVVGLVFSGLGLYVATLIKNSQTFQIVQAAITMPFTFLCGAYIPISSLPNALKIVAYFNPMTYTTALFRTVVLEKLSLAPQVLVQEQLAFKFGNMIVTPMLSLAITIAFGILFMIMSTLLFTRVDFSKINRSNLKTEDVFN